MEVKRICIYPKDVQRITGKSERYGRSLLAQIRNHYQKQEHQFVSIDDITPAFVHPPQHPAASVISFLSIPQAPLVQSVNTQALPHPFQWLPSFPRRVSPNREKLLILIRHVTFRHKKSLPAGRLYY